MRLKRFINLLTISFLALGIQACSSNDNQYRINYEDYHITDQPKHLVLSNVYSYQQTTNYTCGPAAIMTLMYHYGKLSASEMNKDTEMRIAKEMNTSMLGTSPESMVDWLRKNGFNAEYGQGVSLDMLVDNINRGIPTIITWNDFNIHSMLVVGYNSQGATPVGDKDVIFTADPASSGSVERNGITTNGIDSLTPNQLELNEINAKVFFHSPSGMYIVATPK